MSEQPDTNWPVSWSAVKEAQLKTWLRATPAQRLAWMEEMLEFARLAAASRSGSSEKKEIGTEMNCNGSLRRLPKAVGDPGIDLLSPALYVTRQETSEQVVIPAVALAQSLHFATFAHPVQHRPVGRFWIPAPAYNPLG